MIKAPDFDRKMLLLATQISHQSEMKAVLLSVLEALLNTMRRGNVKGEGIEEAMSLVRCIIRLSLKILDEPVVNRFVFFFMSTNYGTFHLVIFFFLGDP